MKQLSTHVFNDKHRKGSTWSLPRMVLSAASAEWSAFKANFGEVSLLNALNQGIHNFLLSSVATGDLLAYDGANWVNKPNVFKNHSTLRSPIALWQLNGDLLDSSGNGYHLAAGAGAATYVPMISGSSIKGAYFDGTFYATRAARTAALDLVGNMTLECLVYASVKPATAPYLVSYADTGETTNNNYLWSLAFTAAEPACRLSYFIEYGAGTNVSVSSTAPALLNRLHHLAWTRSGTTLKFFVDGVLVDTTAGVHVPEIGASPTQKVFIGNDPAGLIAANMAIASVCVIGSALTDAQVIEDAQYCMPWLKYVG